MAAGSVVLMGHLAVSCALIYVVCWCVFVIYRLVTRPIFAYLEKKLPLRLPEIPTE